MIRSLHRFRAKAVETAFAALLIVSSQLLSGCGRPQDVEAGPSCAVCGMKVRSSQGRFVLHFADGDSHESCSGRCASLIVAEQGSKPYRVRVFAKDLNEMIDGNRAYFVLGAGILPEGSMPPSVFAFSSPEAAAGFLKASGGRLSVLQEVLNLALDRQDGDPGTR